MSRRLTLDDLEKGKLYVVVMFSSGYTDAEYIGFGGFRLKDGRTVWPSPGCIKELHERRI